MPPRPSIDFDKDTKPLQSFSKDTGKKMLLQMKGKKGYISDCRPDLDDEMYLIDTTEIYPRRLRETAELLYETQAGFAEVEVRNIPASPTSMLAHPGRAETAPDRPYFSCFAKKTFEVHDVIGILCGEVIPFQALGENPLADPFVFFLIDPLMRLDCRTRCNQLAFIQPPEGFDNQDIPSRTNCSFFYCEVEGRATLAVVAVKAIHAGEELRAERDANFWDFTNKNVVDDLSRYARQTLHLLRSGPDQHTLEIPPLDSVLGKRRKDMLEREEIPKRHFAPEKVVPIDTKLY